MSRTVPRATSFEEGRRLAALRGTLENPLAILVQIGVLGVAESQKAFREQKLGAIRWKTRGETGMNPNWPAAIRDLSTSGARIKMRHFQDSPVLMSSGRGRRSVASRVVSGDTVEWGTNLTYMNDLHAGNETMSDPVTSTVKQRLREMIKRSARSGRRAATRARKSGSDEDRQKWARIAERGDGLLKLKWLLDVPDGEQIRITHPARPIVGMPDSLIEDIETTVGVIVNRAGNAA